MPYDSQGFDIKTPDASGLSTPTHGRTACTSGVTQEEWARGQDRSQVVALVRKVYAHFRLRTCSVVRESFQRRPDLIPSLFVFLWPMFYLLPYLLSYEGIALRSGSDFYMVYYKYKVYLLDVLSSDLRVPLWSPSEGGGYPFYSNPFAAAYYPPNIFLLILYRLAGGYTPDDHQVFTILGICVLCLGLYRWLRSLGSGIRPALFTALVMGTSMKVTELMRFPNAIHAAAWMPWILYGITLALQRSSVRKGIGIVGTATLMIFTAGYPYYVYYLQFLLGPYILLLLFHTTRQALHATQSDTEFVGVTKGLLAPLAGFGMAFVISSPYLLKVMTLLAQTTDRGGLDFQFSTRHTWTLLDTLGSLAYPPAAMAEGWYHFGIVSLLVMLLWLPSAFAHPRSRRGEALFASVVLVWFGLVTYITLGKASYLFRLLWYYFPGFSRLQAWPRLNIILIPIFAMLLARAYAYFEHPLTKGEGSPTPGLASRMRWLALFYGVIAIIQISFLAFGYENDYWTRYFSGLKYVEKPWFLVTGFVSFGVLVAVMPLLYQRSLRTHFGAMIVMLLLFLANTLSIGPLGVRQWSHSKGYSLRQRLGISEMLPRALSTRRTVIYDTIQLGPAFNVGIISHWYYKRYTDFMAPARLSEDGQISPRKLKFVPRLETLMGVEDGRRFFFTRALWHTTVESFVGDDRATQEECDLSVKVLKYNGDALDAEVKTRCPVYFSFIDNWDPDWKAEVNDRPVRVEAAFGTFKSLRIESGTSRIRFVYSPFVWSPKFP